MRKNRSSELKGQVKIKKKERLPSRVFGDKKWKEFDEFVEREMEDMYLTLKNAGFE